MSKKIIYGIHGNNDVVFFDLDAAETYLLNNYQEHIRHKDQFIEYCENMIWEDCLMYCYVCEQADTHESAEENHAYFESSLCGDFYKHNYCSL